MLSKTIRLMATALLVSLLISLPGCTARTLTITSNPPGAEVTVNRRFIGLTPVRVGFTHYGTYRIELRKERYETLVKEECINPPIYGYDPITLVVDNAIPARLNDDIYVHYVLKPAGDVSERSALLQRAELARSGMITIPSTGQQVTVGYSVPPKTPEQQAKLAAENAPAKPAPGTDTGKPPVVAPPPVDFTAKKIQTVEPEGPTISKELNIKPSEPVKKPDAPKAPSEPRKDQPPARTPKSEELIFDNPNAPKADAPKPDAPKSEAPKPGAPKPPATPDVSIPDFSKPDAK
jgi:hypothetical protein